MNRSEERTLITTAEAMEKLRCGRTKFYELINTGKISAYRDGGRTLVDAGTIDAYQSSLRRIQPRAAGS